ncbi:hypothetical protein RUM43_010814 [Polyplax serrata]|uniref:Uncharacterized protein n=1 Tax=Polyplax serrata TaxID=468196 RepID=A0AAN8S0H2_POLSC
MVSGAGRGFALRDVKKRRISCLSLQLRDETLSWCGSVLILRLFAEVNELTPWSSSRSQVAAAIHLRPRSRIGKFKRKSVDCRGTNAMAVVRIAVYSYS